MELPYLTDTEIAGICDGVKMPPTLGTPGPARRTEAQRPPAGGSV